MNARMSQRAALAFALLLVGAVGFELITATALFPATKKPPAHPIDINSASSAQLQEVPGIGPATADKILQMRKSYGAFKSVDDLLSVRGIGPKRLEKMRKYLVAGHAAPRRIPTSPPTATKGATCTNCPRAAPVSSASKKVPVAPAKASKPVASDGDASENDEEPE
jgi:competence ComEA-like helix-hairpin-helix protein